MISPSSCLSNITMQISAKKTRSRPGSMRSFERSVLPFNRNQFCKSGVISQTFFTRPAGCGNNKWCKCSMLDIMNSSWLSIEASSRFPAMHLCTLYDAAFGWQTLTSAERRSLILRSKTHEHVYLILRQELCWILWFIIYGIVNVGCVHVWKMTSSIHWKDWIVELPG